ncbi:MAG: hypothetical protein AAFO91_05025, partial [Bacteroidota bacterium]
MKKKIRGANKKGHVGMQLESRADMDFLRLVRGYVDCRMIDEESMRGLGVEHDSEGVPLFAMLYYLFVSGSYDIMARVLVNYKGSLESHTRRLLRVFEDWQISLRGCDKPNYFELSPRLLHNQSNMKSNLSMLNSCSEGSFPFLQMLLCMMLQQRVSSANIREAIVKSYQDWLLVSLASGLDFGIQSRVDLAGGLCEARDKIREIFMDDDQVKSDFVNEMAQSLQYGEMIIGMSTIEGCQEEMLHCALLLSESGLSEVMDLYRDVFYIEESQKLVLAAPSEHDRLKMVQQTLRDWILVAGAEFARRICKIYPVEALVYIDLLDHHTPIEMEKGLAVVKTRIGKSSHKKKLEESKERLLPLIEPHNLILLERKLEEFKITRARDLVVGNDLFGELFSPEVQSIQRYKEAEALCSKSFFRRFLDVLSESIEASIPKIQRVRLLEVSGRVKEILKLAVQQSSEVIATLSDFGYEANEKDEYEHDLGIERRLKRFRSSQSKEARGLIRPLLCLQKGSEFRIPDYLGQILLVNKGSILFNQDQLFEESRLLTRVELIFMNYLKNPSMWRALEYIERGDVYGSVGRVSDPTALSLLRLIEFHLCLIREIYM